MPSASDDIPGVDAGGGLIGPQLTRRRSILARLERVNSALRAWEQWEANRHLPPDLRRQLRKPTLSREALTGLHRMLVEELGRLEQEWERRN